jgi:hypothetical protein
MDVPFGRKKLDILRTSTCESRLYNSNLSNAHQGADRKLHDVTQDPGPAFQKG